MNGDRWAINGGVRRTKYERQTMNDEVRMLNREQVYGERSTVIGGGWTIDGGRWGINGEARTVEEEPLGT